MEKVREELICAVCLDFLREPKVLLCAHSFCQRCLREVINGQKHKQNTALRSVDLECPSCRHVTNLEHGRVEIDLRTNFNLKRLAEIVSDEEKSRTLKVNLRAWLAAYMHNFVPLVWSLACLQHGDTTFSVCIWSKLFGVWRVEADYIA